MVTKPKVKMNDEPETIEKVIEEETHAESESEETEDVVDEIQPTSLEELDPTEELWPEGPTVGDILTWKQEFGDVYVTSLTLDKHVVWRTLDRSEYRAMIRTMEDMAQKGNLTSAEIQLFQEDYISDIAILFPKFSPQDKEKDLAGLATIISQEVMDASGFVALEIRQL